MNTTHSSAAQEKYALNRQFSIKECVYLCNDNGVVFSPMTTETLLCDKKLVTYLIALEQDLNAEESLKIFKDSNPSYANEVLKRLLDMHIIFIKEQTG